MPVTREQLYERLWQTPTVRLCKEFGLSDVGLAKLCSPLPIVERTHRSLLSGRQLKSPTLAASMSKPLVERARQWTRVARPFRFRRASR